MKVTFQRQCHSMYQATSPSQPQNNNMTTKPTQHMVSEEEKSVLSPITEPITASFGPQQPIPLNYLNTGHLMYLEVNDIIDKNLMHFE